MSERVTGAEDIRNRKSLSQVAPSQFSVTEIVTAGVALYGAGLSSYIAARSFVSDKPKLTVTYGWGYPAIAATIDFPETLALYATNVGRREVVVSMLALELEGYACITPGFLEEMAKFPKSDKNRNAGQELRLKPGDKIESVFDASQLIQFLKRSPELRVRAYCEDTLENRFLGKWIDMPSNWKN